MHSKQGIKWYREIKAWKCCCLCWYNITQDECILAETKHHYSNKQSSRSGTGRQILLGLCCMNPMEDPTFRAWMSTLADHLFELTYTVTEQGSAIQRGDKADFPTNLGHAGHTPEACSYPTPETRGLTCVPQRARKPSDKTPEEKEQEISFLCQKQSTKATSWGQKVSLEWCGPGLLSSCPTKALFIIEFHSSITLQYIKAAAVKPELFPIHTRISVS